MLNRYRIVYLITFLSGAAGLIYEIAWTRMLVIIFGNGAHSTVAVISAFLGGIALGSLFVGSWTNLKNPHLLKKTYTIFEFGIAASALASIVILPLAYKFYSMFSDGTHISVFLMLLRFGISLLIVLVPTVLMGGTIPILVAILKSKLERLDSNISLLYSLNTLGAVFGVLLAAFITIEILGIKETILVGAVLNVIAGFLMLVIPTQTFRAPDEVKVSHTNISVALSEKIILFCFFVTGFITIAYEVVWSRVLAPSIGTFIYAFAAVLAIYLFGIFLGALIYNKYLQNLKLRNNLFSLSQAGIGICALMSAIIVSVVYQYHLALTLGSIFLASIFMGISFPSGAFLLRRTLHVGRMAGFLYFLNTLGCILGGIVTAFIFIPSVGSVSSIVIFSLLNILLAILILALNIKFVKTGRGMVIFSILASACIFGLYLLVFQRGLLNEYKTRIFMQEMVAGKGKVSFREDSLTSVVGFKVGDEGGVVVNGEGMTGLVLETRLMAHIPIAIHPDAKKFLAICFGMGSTYRSARLHGIDVDAVELSPSVVTMFPMFYDDVDKLPGKGRIITNDGRNYVNLTNKKYDIITVDPPPPLNAAGTTVLYSEDFYSSMKRILNPNGIVMEWMIPGNRSDDMLMTQKSFLNSFPYVLGLRWDGETKGTFMLGSMSPIELDKDKMNKVLFSNLVRDDILKFHRLVDADKIKKLIVSRDQLIEETKNVRSVTDDHPLTEYFALRYLLSR